MWQKVAVVPGSWSRSDTPPIWFYALRKSDLIEFFLEKRFRSTLRNGRASVGIPLAQ